MAQTTSPERTALVVQRVETMREGLISRLAAFVRNVLAFVREGGDDVVPDAIERIVTAVEEGRREVDVLARVYAETVMALESPVPSTQAQARQRDREIRQAEREREARRVEDHEALIDEWADLIERHLIAAGDEIVAEAEQALREDMEAALRGGTRTGAATFFRRVIHPEMSEGGTCGLCVAAAHRKYSTPNLRPIHDGCKCTVAPGNDDIDPGKDLNDDDLDKVYKAAGTADGYTLKQARFVYRDGDLTPVKERVKKGKRSTTGASARAYDDATGLGEKSAEWLTRQITLTEGLPASTWRSTQLKRLRAELAKRG